MTPSVCPSSVRDLSCTGGLSPYSYHHTASVTTFYAVRESLSLLAQQVCYMHLGCCSNVVDDLI